MSSGYRLLSREALDRKAKKYQKAISLLPNESSSSSSTVFPEKCDLSNKIKKVYDQESISSCTSNAICQAFNMLNVTDLTFDPSRLYVYWAERYIENGDSSKNLTDNGADADDGLSWCQNVGICPEIEWPYVLSKVDDAPPSTVHTPHKISQIIDIGGTGDNLLTNIKIGMTTGFPVLVAIEVYSSFMNHQVASNGIVPMPKTDSEQFEGGHEVLLVGYDDSKQLMMFVNSWGNLWGQNGYGWLPYSYITNSQLTVQLRYFKQVI